ncbi:MAG: hypothetical protein JWO36_3749 [Myxococcales bacterium]|nr:hypothetical protein [Myxococcales bacterium]
MKALLVLSLALFTHLGCSSHEGSPTATAPKSVEASPADDKALCVQVFTRARTCTDDYIPALVDSRAKLDQPPGIAAQVKADRAAVVATAKQEWADDSQDAKISANCDQMSAKMTGDDRAQANAARDCIAKDCPAFAACITPIFEKHLAK